MLALLLTAVCFFQPGYTLFAQEKEEKEEGKLGKLEEEVDKKEADEADKDEDSEKKEENSTNNSEESSNSSDVVEDVGAFLKLLEYSFYAVVVVVAGVYVVLINAPGEDSLLYLGDYSNCYFSQYPYISSEEGLFSQVIGKRFSVNISGHYFYDESNLTGYGVRAKYSPHPFFNAELHFSDLTEKLETREDHLKLYNVFINYNRLRLERWAFWWGLGLKGLQGDKTYNGFAFNIGAEIYPVRPISIGINYSGGFISGNYVPEFFGALNLHLYRFAIFAGYQYWSAGSAKIDGLVGGMKVFF